MRSMGETGGVSFMGKRRLGGASQSELCCFFCPRNGTKVCLGETWRESYAIAGANVARRPIGSGVGEKLNKEGEYPRAVARLEGRKVEPSTYLAPPSLDWVALLALFGVVKTIVDKLKRS